MERKPLAAILTDGATPSTDYFILPYLEVQGYAITILEGRSEPGADAFKGKHFELVVISRYVSGDWLSVLERMREQGTALAFFMDDDLLDLSALRGLPLHYRWKILSRTWWYRDRILSLCDAFWVSTPFLAEKYREFKPVLIAPLPSGATMEAKTCVRVCYHGTASHPSEIAWLVPVMRTVLEQNECIHFELFGNRNVAKCFSGLPRVSVKHPMSWQNYLAYTACHGIDIALAPLLPGEFNAARGVTKFFDYTRMGAAGLYSNVSPYRDFVRNGVDGLLIENEPEEWVEAILRLATDKEKRVELSLAARQRLLDMINTNN